MVRVRALATIRTSPIPVNGALSEYFTADAGWLHRAPRDCSDAMGALIEPFTIADNATSNIDASDTVVVLGAGPIGLCAMASAAAKGSRVIAVEPAPNRRALALALGAEHTIDPSTQDAVGEIEDLTHGRGAEVVIEASGNGAAMASAFRMAAFNGRLVNVGITVHAEALAPPGQGRRTSPHHPWNGRLSRRMARGHPLPRADRSGSDTDHFS
jgi:threonine dehydrogenase-like Zn-dependent dehydrogenase